MTLPKFNPQEIPSQPLQALDATLTRPLVLTLDALRDALSAPRADVPILTQDAVSVDQPRAAAVLIVLIERELDFDVVLTVRANHLRHHGGQISFVGGTLDEGELALDAALREAREEISLAAEPLSILGELPVYQTITGFAVTPIVASISPDDWARQSIQVNPDEVDHVFTVPLSVLLNHESIHVHQYEWQQHVRQYYSVRYKEYFIWGASMAMLRNLDILLRSL